MHNFNQVTAAPAYILQSLLQQPPSDNLQVQASLIRRLAPLVCHPTFQESLLVEDFADEVETSQSRASAEYHLSDAEGEQASNC